MGAAPITLLLTRPQAQSARFAQAFAARFGADFPVVISPLQEIVPNDTKIALDGITGLIFSSENGVESFANHSRGRRFSAYCVGERTAQAARKRGLDVRFVAANADALVAEVGAHRPGGRLLHLRGKHARGAVAERLEEAGQACGAAVIYDQIRQKPSQSAQETLAGKGAVLTPLFSPRSAVLFTEVAQGTPAPLFLATMSAAVTQAWNGPEPCALEQAETPGATAMLDALGRLIDAVQRLEGGRLPS